MNDYLKRYIADLSHAEKEDIMKRVLLPPVDERRAEIYRRLLAGQSPYVAAGEMSKLGYGERSTLIYHAESVSDNILREKGLSPEMIMYDIIEGGPVTVPTVWKKKVKDLLTQKGYFPYEGYFMAIEEDGE